VKATASGMVSDKPIVKGLGPRDDPTGIDVVVNVILFRLAELSARLIGGGMLGTKLGGIGLWRPRVD
jgi:hypothetical protein